MERQGCSADEAFDILRRGSQRENRKLRDVAIDIIAASGRRHAMVNGDGHSSSDGDEDRDSQGHGWDRARSDKEVCR